MTCAPSHMGRPRVHDRDQLAAELIEWAKQEDSLNLNGFCCSRDPPIAPSKLTIWSRECPNFCKAYETAKAFIGYRRELKLSKNELHVKAYDLNAAVYDYFLKEERMAQTKFEAEISKDVSQSFPEQYMHINEKLRNELAQARQELSERKSSATIIINESKS